VGREEPGRLAGGHRRSYVRDREKLRDLRQMFAVSHHQVQVGKAAQEGLPLALRQTARHTQSEPGPPGLQRLQCPETAVQLLFGLVSDAAPVEDDQVRVVFLLG